MTEEDKAKQDVIPAVFYDDESGYGSKISTLKHAKQIHKNITMDDLTKFMNKVTFRNKTDISIVIHLLLIFLGMNLWWI